MKALLHCHPRSRAFTPPGAAQDGLETYAMLIGSPQLDCGMRERLLHLVQARRQVFLKASWVTGSALAWRGRRIRLL